MKLTIPAVVSSAIVIVLVTMFCVYTVDQRQAAIRFRLGEVVGVQTEPGLYFKLPAPLENVRHYDTRIQTIDAREPERIQTVEKANVLVDAYVKYRIVDVKQYYVAAGGARTNAEVRLLQTINNDLRDEFSRRTLADVVSGERDKIMENLRAKVDTDARGLGIEVMDVRLKRVDLVPEISNDVYRRMDSERKRVANELRSTGSGDAEKIRADAERQREIILAEAYRDAQKIKGEGDATATKIYAAAYGRNPEFYAFYRSLEAYRAGLKNKSDVMVLDPSSEFFKYLKSPGKGGK
ncbi:MAG TPA: protease modulator HflC [Usitatibacteraceae bacterium]|nr:protease modulator HflC [Usitatibacteraceae bacterium]